MFSAWVASFHTFSQYAPDYRMPVQVIEKSGITKKNYPVWFIIDTEVQVSNGRMESDGRDIRFANDTCLSVNYPYWIENYMNTDSTLIWVLIDEIKANDTADLWIFFGDPSASAATSFSGVFPKGLVTTVNVNMAGLQDIGYFHLSAGDTLKVGPSQLLNIKARKIIIDGVIQGTGKGYPPVYPGVAMGLGPGGGNGSSNAGSGGGGYGGAGGLGGYDTLDTPGAAGTANGSSSAATIDMGSAGGSSNNTSGAAGGAGVWIDSEFITINGSVVLNGGNSPPLGGNGGSRGGGGGSGGGFMLVGNRIYNNGQVLLNGGNGSPGSNSTDDSGGGGGGGRMKTFYGDSYTAGPSILISVDSGFGGPNGDKAPGQDGLPGTIHAAPLAYDTVKTVFGSIQTQTGGLTLSTLLFTASDPDTSICPGDYLEFTASSGFLNYEFDLNSVSQQSGTNKKWGSSTLNHNDKVRIIVSYDGCYKWAEMTIGVNSTVFPFILLSDPFPCQGDTVVFSLTQAYSSYSWSNGDTSATTTAMATGPVTVTVTDTILCPGFDSVFINFGGVNPAIAGGGIACDGDTLILSAQSGGISYSWNTGSANDSIEVTQSGTYQVTIQDGNGCVTSDSIQQLFNPLPAPVISVNGDTLDAGPGMNSYQWYFGGNELTGETSQVHIAQATGNYHVVATDTNGCTGSSQVLFIFVSTGQLLPGGTIDLYPNPATYSISIHSKGPDLSACRISVIDLNGRLLPAFAVLPDPSGSEVQIDISSLAAGIYLVKVDTGSGTWNGRFVRQ